MILIEEAELESIEIETMIRHKRDDINLLKSQLKSLQISEYKKYSKKIFKFMEFKCYAYESNKYKEFFEAKDYGLRSSFRWIFVNDLKKCGAYNSTISNIMKINEEVVRYYLHKCTSQYEFISIELKKQFENWKQEQGIS